MACTTPHGTLTIPAGSNAGGMHAGVHVDFYVPSGSGLVHATFVLPFSARSTGFTWWITNGLGTLLQMGDGAQTGGTVTLTWQLGSTDPHTVWFTTTLLTTVTYTLSGGCTTSQGTVCIPGCAAGCVCLAGGPLGTGSCYCPCEGVVCPSGNCCHPVGAQYTCGTCCSPACVPPKVCTTTQGGVHECLCPSGVCGSGCPCPSGETCVSGHCQCTAGACSPSCPCPAGKVCYLGTCVTPGVCSPACVAPEICVGGHCVLPGPGGGAPNSNVGLEVAIGAGVLLGALFLVSRSQAAVPPPALVA